MSVPHKSSPVLLRVDQRDQYTDSKHRIESYRAYQIGVQCRNYLPDTAHESEEQSHRSECIENRPHAFIAFVDRNPDDDEERDERQSRDHNESNCTCSVVK